MHHPAPFSGDLELLRSNGWRGCMTHSENGIFLPQLPLANLLSSFQGSRFMSARSSLQTFRRWHEQNSIHFHTHDFLGKLTIVHDKLFY